MGTIKPLLARGGVSVARADLHELCRGFLRQSFRALQLVNSCKRGLTGWGVSRVFWEGMKEDV